MFDRLRKAGRFAGAACLAFAIAAGGAVYDDADAARRKQHASQKKPGKKGEAKKAAAEAYSPKQAYIVVEAATGRVLKKSQSDELRHPASLTKMMTLLLVFEAIEKGQLRLDQNITVSDNAASYPPTKVCRADKDCGEISVETAIRALIVKSANDISVALAEAVAGSHPAFIAMMNAKAAELGMGKTVFKNANGLPHKEQVSTAEDFVKLTQALLNKPHDKYYHYFSERYFKFDGRSFSGHNRLMYRYPGMDGLKTGFINMSGFNLAASAERKDRRIIVIFFGGGSAKSRDYKVESLMNEGFSILRRSPSPLPAGTKPAMKPG